MADGDEQIVERLRSVRAEIDAAAAAAGRAAGDVELLLATKTQSPERILVALAAGYTLIGENRVQEVVAKVDELAVVPHHTHYIGHLQANKINQLLDHIDCLQTIDSIELAQRLNSRLEQREKSLDVLIQVNVSGEETKSGVAPDAALELLAKVAALPQLAVRGYMTIGLNSTDIGAVRAGYATLRELRDTAISQEIAGADRATQLSMGMSGDFAAAIAEGATMVRLGSAVFGSRPPVT